MPVLLLHRLAAAAGLLACAADAINIVAVHGLGGWGPTELLGVGYWGLWNIPNDYNRTNYLELLADGGKNRVMYATVGKFSSTWDRACELYAEIVGARVDYGYWHAKANNHTRYGRDYTGKGWLSTFGPDDKISLVGHSLGGPTMRHFELLMQKGAPSELAPYPPGEAPPNPLFYGGRDWIVSIHSISGVLNGSPFYQYLSNNTVDFIKTVLFSMTGLLEFLSPLGTLDWGYDMMLDQFGFSRGTYTSGSDNGFKAYFEAVLDPSNYFFTPGFTDNGGYACSIEASYALNSASEYTYPNTYYFSHVTARTGQCWLDGQYQCPITTSNEDMSTPMQPLSIIIGSISTSNGGCSLSVKCSSADSWCQQGATATPTPFCYDATWQENDGLVPSRSSRSPEIGVRRGTYVPPVTRGQSSGGWNISTWYYREHGGPLGRDHVQIIGFDSNDGDYIGGDSSDHTYQEILTEIYWVWANLPKAAAAAAAATTTTTSTPTLMPTATQTNEQSTTSAPFSTAVPSPWPTVAAAATVKPSPMPTDSAQFTSGAPTTDGRTPASSRTLTPSSTWSPFSLSGAPLDSNSLTASGQTGPIMLSVFGVIVGVAVAVFAVRRYHARQVVETMSSHHSVVIAWNHADSLNPTFTGGAHQTDSEMGNRSDSVNFEAA